MNKREVRAVLNKNIDSSRTPNHRGRGRTPAEKRRDYAEYNRRKKIVFRAEERNFEHLVLFLASDGTNPEKKQKFYMMGGNSAIIYVNEIAPRMGRKNAVLRPDLDNTDERFKYGMAAIASLDKLEEGLAKLGIKKVVKNSNEFIVYFKLNRKYTKDEIKQLIKSQESKVKEVNKILYAEVVHPDVHVLVMKIKKTIFYNVAKMDHVKRELLQNRLLDPVFRIADAYTLMAHGDKSEEECARMMLEDLDILKDRILMMQDLQLWDVSTCAKAGSEAAELTQVIKGKIINKIAKNETSK